jgi:exosortase F-associated protein
MTSNILRIGIGSLALLGLIMVFVFQRIDFSGVFGFTFDALGKFMFNRTLRFLLNDLLAIALIFAIFQERKYVVFAFWVQLAGVILILIPYFIFKVHYPAYNGPLLSHLHRLIMNPTLLLLLIPAFYYQKLYVRR